MMTTAIEAADEGRMKNQPAMRLIQHGPQYNYVAYMRDKEQGKPISASVAAPSVPLAMCDRGVCRVIASLDELAAFFATSNVNVKGAWELGKPGPTAPSSRSPSLP